MFSVMTLRDKLPFDSKPLADDPNKIADYCRQAIIGKKGYNPDVESCWVIVMNTRRRIEGHFLVATGTLDTLLVHAREVFRGAILANAAAIVLMHNHPSGDPTPSEADIRVTREMIRAGQLLKIEVLDHVILGEPKHCSLKELGYFTY